MYWNRRKKTWEPSSAAVERESQTCKFLPNYFHNVASLIVCVMFVPTRSKRKQWQQPTSLLWAESHEPEWLSTAPTETAVWTVAGHSQPGLSEKSSQGGHEEEEPTWGGRQWWEGRERGGGRRGGWETTFSSVQAGRAEGQQSPKEG